MAASAQDDAIQPYDPAPRELAAGVYIWDGEWRKSPLKRRMTIVRLRSGGLLIHNAIRLHEPDYARLAKLGPVAGIVVPNFFHSSDAHFYKLRFPQAGLYVSRGVAGKMRKRCPVDGILPEAWPWQDEVACLEFQGTRWLFENVLLHRASRTAIFTDLVFNMQTDVAGGTRLFFMLNKIHKRFGPSRLLRWVLVNDMQKARASFREILALDFDRAVMNHGEVLERGAKRALERGCAELGLL